MLKFVIGGLMVVLMFAVGGSALGDAIVSSELLAPRSTEMELLERHAALARVERANEQEAHIESSLVPARTFAGYVIYVGLPVLVLIAAATGIASVAVSLRIKMRKFEHELMLDRARIAFQTQQLQQTERPQPLPLREPDRLDLRPRKPQPSRTPKPTSRLNS
jgi:hypothetical protein